MFLASSDYDKSDANEAKNVNKDSPILYTIPMARSCTLSTFLASEALQKCHMLAIF